MEREWERGGDGWREGEGWMERGTDGGRDGGRDGGIEGEEMAGSPVVGGYGNCKWAELRQRGVVENREMLVVGSRNVNRAPPSCSAIFLTENNPPEKLFRGENNQRDLVFTNLASSFCFLRSLLMHEALVWRWHFHLLYSTL